MNGPAEKAGANMTTGQFLAQIILLRVDAAIVVGVLVSCSCSEVEDVATATPRDPRETAYSQLAAIVLPPAGSNSEAGAPLPAELGSLESGELLKLQGTVDLDDLDREYDFAIIEFSMILPSRGRTITNSGLAELSTDDGRVTFEFKTKAPRDPGKHDLIIYLLSVEKDRKTICSGSVEVRGEVMPSARDP